MKRTCSLCGSSIQTVTFRTGYVCKPCLQLIRKLDSQIRERIVFD